ncbi:MAG: hypothetical protein QM754_14135 [Tepidisphaeraceae bacterium]
MNSARRRIGYGILVLFCGATHSRAAEPTTPDDIYLVYTQAISAGNLDVAKKYAVADDSRMRLLTNRPAAAEAEKAFRAAVDAAFPGQFKDVHYTAPTTQPEDPARPPRVVYNKETATLSIRDTAEVVRFRRVNGEWKVDLNAMYSPTVVDETEKFRGALTEVMNAVAAEAKAGRYKTLNEVQAELATRVKMRLATPDLPATTRPTF